MLDIKYIRENIDLVQLAARQKGYVKANALRVVELDDMRRELSTRADELRAQRNQLAASMNGAKPDPETIERGKRLKIELAELEDQLSETISQYEAELYMIPNMPMDVVPIGATEDENVVIKTVGEPTRFDFEPRNHAEIATAKGWLDKERAAKVAGSRFAYLKGDLVMLEWAMRMWAMQKLTDRQYISSLIERHGLGLPDTPFVAIDPPAMARTEIYEATCRLDGEQQTYKLADDDLWLNASAEHVMASMYVGEIIDPAQLPIRMVGFTTAFRREAGTYGKDMDGFLRMHQFNKLEMEVFSDAASGLEEHRLTVAIQEDLMSQLGLPYRVLEKCTADIGGPNAKGVDIDVWLPGQNRYRETHTADYMTDYQARRMQTRTRGISGETVFVHTNDATAFSQRPLIAIIENFQTREGDVVVPEVLRPYMGGREII